MQYTKVSLKISSAFDEQEVLHDLSRDRIERIDGQGDDFFIPRRYTQLALHTLWNLVDGDVILEFTVLGSHYWF